MKTVFLFMISILFAASNANAGGGSSVGPANPAAVNCEQLGGTLEPFTTPQGEDANCAIEEWSLYRQMASRNLLTPHSYTGMVPNPAAVNCNDVNGIWRLVETPQGQSGLCVVEQWTLYRVINVTQ